MLACTFFFRFWSKSGDCFRSAHMSATIYVLNSGSRYSFYVACSRPVVLTHWALNKKNVTANFSIFLKNQKTRRQSKKCMLKVKSDDIAKDIEPLTKRTTYFIWSTTFIFYILFIGKKWEIKFRPDHHCWISDRLNVNFIRVLSGEIFHQ